ncbi:MAG: enoyl-CoA hydratase/isomerase family protein [Gammaproteobacteria bacterium]|nr:enoyl-CoA hydratase/isomerase family protein [Gammaproteobacteria bacterium]
MSYTTIRFTRAGAVARITLARPDAANALNFAMGAELLDVARRCRDDKGVRAVILDADGKVFCAGGDIVTFASAGDRLPTALKELIEIFHPAVEILSTMNAPVIAAVQGVAAGAGLSLLSSCSLVIASDAASFTMAYTGIGLTPDGGATYFLPRQIGLRKTEELMITNRRLNAAEALDWGLVNEVVTPEALAGRVDALANQLAAGATAAYGAARRMLLASFGNTMTAQLALEQETMVAAGGSRDGLAGVAAFKAKTRPEFRGEQ